MLTPQWPLASSSARKGLQGTSTPNALSHVRRTQKKARCEPRLSEFKLVAESGLAELAAQTSGTEEAQAEQHRCCAAVRDGRSR